MNCVVLDDYQGLALSLANWKELKNCSVKSLTTHLEGDALVEELKDADIIVIMRERTPINRQLLNNLPSLKLIVTSGMRNASIDMVAAKEKNIIVCGTKSLKFPPMELAWALILNMSRHVYREASEFKKSGPWQSTLGRSLHSKTIGLLGLGHIGQLMVPVAKAFGMHILAWSPNLTQARCDSVGVEFATSKARLFREADIISVHLVLSETTRYLITLQDLQLMKSDALFINTSRADIVNNDDLVGILEENRIGGAGIDVFECEPLPVDDSLRKLDNVLATPHLGYVADTNYQHYFSEAIDDIKCYLAGQPIRLIHA